MASEIDRLRSGFDAAERPAALGRLLADDFRSIGEQGFVLDEEQWIGKFADFAYTSLDSTDVEVRSSGHTAVVRCVQRSNSTWRGQEVTPTVRAGQTWVRLPEGWRLAALQFSSFNG